MGKKKLDWGILGGGGDSLIGILQVAASLSINDNYEIVGAVFNVDFEGKAWQLQKRLMFPTHSVFIQIDTLFRKNELPETKRSFRFAYFNPVTFAFPHGKKIVRKGFHVICEKPMTTSCRRSKKYYKQPLRKAGTVFVYQTYGYPMVREMRERIQAGELGKIHK